MRIRSLVLDNLSWKLLSLGLAVLVWYGAHVFMRGELQPIVRPLEPLALRDFPDLPVRFLGGGADPPFRATPATVLVRVSGELSLVSRLTAKDPVVYVEVPAGPLDRPRTNRVEVHLPPSIRLLGVAPERVVVQPDLPRKP